MTTPFQPNKGDTVEFYNEEAELWETGTVFSSSADRRFYFVQPDDENQPMHVVNYTSIRPPTEPEPAAPSFWEAAKRAVRQRNAWLAVATEEAARAEKAEREVSSLKERQSSIADERDMWMRQAVANSVNIGKLRAQIDAFPYETGAPVGDKVAARIAEYRERAERAEADLTQCRKALHDANARAFKNAGYKNAFDMAKERAEKAEARHQQLWDQLNDEHTARQAAEKRADDMEADRDGWAQEANDNQYISRIGYEERDQARARVKELEAELAKLQAQIDAAPYATGYPVGDRVVVRIDDYRERTHAAEERAEKAEAARDEYRDDAHHFLARANKLENEIAELKKALRTLATGEESPETTAVIDGEGDQWELNRGTGLYENGSFNQTLDTIEKVWGIKERIH